MANPAVGIQSWLGVGEESTWATAVTPTRFIPITEESLKAKVNFKSPAGILPGYHSTRSSAEVITSQSAEGGIKCEVPKNGFGLFLKYLMGTSSNTSLGSGAYKQTHSIGTVTAGKGLTIQKFLGDVAGTEVEAFTYIGCRIPKAEFSIDVDGFLECSLDIDSKYENKAIAPTSPTFIDTQPFHFAELNVKLDGSPVTAPLIKGVSVAIERPVESDRRGAGAAGFKAEQFENGTPKVSGKIKTEFSDMTTFYNKFVSGTAASFELVCVGTNIGGSYDQTFSLTIPKIHYRGESPNIKGEGIVELEIPFEARWDGTNALAKIDYTTSDTTY